MEDKASGTDVRSRLVLAGLHELEEHGLRDFSLRRVAQGAQVSCAAPYRHFRDKEELILAVISHVREGWTLLADEIYAAYSDPTERVMALCVNAVRFWVANGNFRSVLLSGQGELDSEKRKEMSLFDAPLATAIRDLTDKNGTSDGASTELAVLAMVHGSVTLISGGCDASAVTDSLTRTLTKLLR